MKVENTLLRRKRSILLLGVGIFFFSSMSKMLVPGPIYNQLLSELLLDPAQIAMLGAIYMYSYAASQLVAGVYSNRLGGVRILLLGGGGFAAGLLCFPLCSSYFWLCLFRCLTGIGAGTVFIGVAKLLNDLFPQKFAVILGFVLFIGYLGPVTGTVPLVWLISASSWRTALLLPGVIVLLMAAGIIVCARGISSGGASAGTFRPLLTMFANLPMWVLCISCGIIFGIYYALLTQIGQKCIEDVYHLSCFRASCCITFLSLVVAANNITVNWLRKLFRNRVKLLTLSGFSLAFIGTVSGYAAFRLKLPFFWLLFAYFLIAVPAGFFALYSWIAKEINPPEQAGLSVAMLNFWAFVFIAVWGNISGSILKAWDGKCVNGIFPPCAYASFFLFLMLSALAAFLFGMLLPPDKGKRAC